MAKLGTQTINREEYMVCHSCKKVFKKTGLNYCPECDQKIEELVLTRFDTSGYELER